MKRPVVRSVCMLAITFVAFATEAQQLPRTPLPPAMWRATSEFNRVGSIRELADGTVLVVDRGDSRVVIVSANGEERGDLARQGSGPGEIVAVGAIYALRGDSSLVTDSYTGRWSTFHRTTFVSVLSEHRELNRALQSDLLGVDGAGRVLGAIPKRSGSASSETRESADSLSLILADLVAETQQNLGTLRGVGGGVVVRQERRTGPPSIVIGEPLGAADRALLFSDGWIAIAYVDPYRVDWIAPAASQNSRFSSNEARVPFTEELACVIQRYRGRIRGDTCPAGRDIRRPEYLPAFFPSSSTDPSPSLLADLSGQLVVARAPDSDALVPRYDVIDRRGQRRAVVLLQRGQRIVGFGTRGVYVTTTDGDGIQSLTRHAWRH